MKRINKIIDTRKKFPTIMSIPQEIKIIHLLEELSLNEIIEEKDAFMWILDELDESHTDNYVMKYDEKTVREYENYIKWLKKIKRTEEMAISKNLAIVIDNAIDMMAVFYPTPKNHDPIEKIFTNEELEHICISSLFTRNIFGKEYIRICLGNEDGIWVDENKMVYKITYELINPEIKSYKPKKVELINNNLIDYLNKHYK
jgi:hypothetical protein